LTAGLLLVLLLPVVLNKSIEDTDALLVGGDKCVGCLHPEMVLRILCLSGVGVHKQEAKVVPA